jgi:hypothetical protein
MHRWWADDDGEETDVDHPTTYLEATHHLAKTATASLVRAQNRSVVVLGRD